MNNTRRLVIVNDLQGEGIMKCFRYLKPNNNNDKHNKIKVIGTIVKSGIR